MKNAEWCLKNDINFTELTVRTKKDGGYAIKNVSTGKDIDTYMAKNKGTGFEIFRRWLNAEHVEPILDDAEKRYLSAMIRPFRDEIECIEKNKSLLNKSECIYFFTKKGNIHYFELFGEGVMYKGMEMDHKYSLEELGL